MGWGFPLGFLLQCFWLLLPESSFEAAETCDERLGRWRPRNKHEDDR